MRPYRRQLLVLVPLLGLFALIAQVAGVGTTERSNPKRVQRVDLVTIAGGTVPDVASTELGATTRRVPEGEVVRMRAVARLRAARLSKGAAAEVVCGILYSRDGDPAWTLGAAYETVVLDRRGAREQVVVERSFVAPAKDTYRMTAACHVLSPEDGARVIASGSMRSTRGLPQGAATPVE